MCRLPAVPCDIADVTDCAESRPTDLYDCATEGDPLLLFVRGGGGPGGVVEDRFDLTLLEEPIGFGSAALYPERPAESDDIDDSSSRELGMLTFCKLDANCI